MSFIISTQAELLKTKRTASFWLSIIAAAFIPTILIIALFTGDDASRAALTADPWTKYFKIGWQVFCIFIVPIYIVLSSTLLTQIEFRNNTWKQVFASPQSLGNIFFSKFLAIHFMILFCFVLFNGFMILSAVGANLFNSSFTFLHHRIDWSRLLWLNFKVYISILGISAIQYWLSLRFKNFIAPMGIGLALLIAGVVALVNQWAHVYKYPYSLSLLSYDYAQKSGRPFLENHEWNSIGYFMVFILIGFLDMKMRKEKG